MNQHEPEQFDQQQSDPIKKMGIGFSFAMWIGILTVLYFFASGIIEKQYNPNSQPDFSEQQGVKQVQLNVCATISLSFKSYTSGKSMQCLISRVWKCTHQPDIVSRKVILPATAQAFQLNSAGDN